LIISDLFLNFIDQYRVPSMNKVRKSTRKRPPSSKKIKTPIDYTPLLAIEANTAVCNKSQANPAALIYSTWDNSWYIPCTCVSFREKAIISHRGVFHDTAEEKDKALEDFFLAKDSCLACKPETPPTKDECTCMLAVEYAELIAHKHPVPVFASLDMVYEAELEAAHAKSRCLYCLSNKGANKKEAGIYRILESKEGTKWAWMNYKPVKIKTLANSQINKATIEEPSAHENNAIQISNTKTTSIDFHNFNSTAIPCTCYRFRAEAVHASGNGTDINQERSKFIAARDECLACQHERPRTIQECSCQEARSYHLSLLQPQTHSIFPTQEQIREASFDAFYERTRCLYCKSKAAGVSIEEEKESTTRSEPALKKLKIKRCVNFWKIENGQPYRMTEYMAELIDEDKKNR